MGLLDFQLVYDFHFICVSGLPEQQINYGPKAGFVSRTIIASDLNGIFSFVAPLEIHCPKGYS
jgi:hypothetical protein